MLKKVCLILFTLLYLLLGEFFLLPEISYSEKKFLIKFATIAPEGSTWLKHMRRLDKTLRAKSQGEMGFRIYAGGIAGDELDVLRKIRIGQIHCAAFSGVGVAQILSMVRILDLPFLFRNYEEMDLVHKELQDFFSTEFRKKGFEFVAWAEVGNVYLFSKKPIRKVADLRGLKVWTWYGDPISKEFFSLMGTNPIPLTITDVTTALNTGMIDTFYAPPLGALALQWHSYVKYMTSLPLAHAISAVLISSKYFQEIPPKLSKTLKNEFQQAMTDLTSDLREQTEESIKLIQKSGLEIIPVPPDSDLQLFYKTHDQVAQRLVGKVYPRELLDRVYAILKRNR
ncbi:MAG: TRAP transporter substrate-binding protein DctP [Deltaproteobacteria bacterium]|nr:MAG: TRAP transporter substrate-binding protein DctP [Deltaproteobacteria bacterium]